MKYSKLIFSIILCLTSFLGDYVVFKSKFSEYQLFRAVSDSIVHASIGCLSSIIFFHYDIGVESQARLYNIIFCTIISSLIDVDHLFVAKSFHWKDLMHLKQRGIFHCTTFWVLITTILLFYSYLAKKLNIYVLNWMFVLAYTSHHIRDANRRGLWLYPYGHSPPFKKNFYVTLVVVLPHIFGALSIFLKPNVKNTVINYRLLV